MVVKNVTVNNCTPETIVIGRRGTFETMQVVFDLTYLIENYGDGTAVLALKRSQDSSAYPAVAAQDGNTLTWVVSEVDTYYVGAGECQLMWYVDEGLAKTIIYPMVVMRDILSTSEEAPDAYQEWVDNLTALGAETLQNAQDAAQSASDAESAKGDAIAAKEAAEEAAEKAEEASVHSPVIQGGYWYIWNNGQYVNTGVQAEGQKGDKGDPGEKGETGNGIASIAKTGTSGLVDTYTVTYTDGTTTTFTVTNGAKGDKGDTGETGNGIASITKTGTSGNVDTYTITYTNGQTTTFTVTNGAVSSVAGKTGAVTLDANDVAFSESGTYDDGTVGKELSNQKNAIDAKAPVIINTASGDIASFADGADGMQIRKIVGTIVPQQAAGTPSPENPLPISGWDGAVLTRTGKNLIPVTEDGYIRRKVNGTTLRTAAIKAYPGQSFVYSRNNLGALAFAFYWCDELGENVTAISIADVTGQVTYRMTNTDGHKFLLLTYPTQNSFAWIPIREGQLEIGSVKTAYEAYKPITSLSVSWQTEAGTIYGGTITLNEDGSADVVSDMRLIDLGTLTWILHNDGFFMGQIGGTYRLKYGGDMYCSIYKQYHIASIGNVPNYGMWNESSAVGLDRVIIKDNRFDNATDFAAAVNGVMLAYTMAVAKTDYHFADVGELHTYLGTNNIWIDTGSITECDYPADTKLYIDGLTAPDEDMIADANIESGKYFVVNNQLYLSTAAIAAGASIIPGTNCTATNLAEALNALNT